MAMVGAFLAFLVLGSAGGWGAMNEGFFFILVGTILDNRHTNGIS